VLLEDVKENGDDFGPLCFTVSVSINQEVLQFFGIFQSTFVLLPPEMMMTLPVAVAINGGRMFSRTILMAFLLYTVRSWTDKKGVSLVHGTFFANIRGKKDGRSCWRTIGTRYSPKKMHTVYAATKLCQSLSLLQYAVPAVHYCPR
jgi:hypothetical protein